MIKDPVIRYSPPSKYDVADYGTIYKVVGENDSHEYFVQCSPNLESPDWRPYSYLLEKAFSCFAVNNAFIKLCLALSDSSNTDKAEHLKKLIDILK
jgi:hypothetical protein